MQNPEAVDLFQRARQSLAGHDLERAQALTIEALGLDAQFTNAFRLLADIHVAKSELTAACALLERARSQLAPGSGRYLAVSLHLARCLLQRGELAGAAAQLDTEAILLLKDIRMLSRAGYLFTCCEDHAGALAVYEKALQLQPENSQLNFNCAAANRAMGQLARAEQLYDRVIALSPQDWEAYRNRSDLRKQVHNSNHVSELREKLQEPGLPAQAKTQLNFALAKELEDLGEYRDSFRFLERGCRTRREVIQYEVGRDCEVMAEIARVFDGERLAGVQAAKDQGAGIILVLGMPRTGTTLVDRILTALPGVVSAGEPDTFARLLGADAAVRAPASAAGERKAAVVQITAEADLAGVGAEYAQQMRERAAHFGGSMIVDKNPMNFLYAGLIQVALPAAKIVHLRRDATDTCYAIYKTLFKSAYPFSYDQRELAQYYLGYRDLMDHWHSVMPGRIYDLRYESLVEDLAGESRSLLEFCGLSWNEVVLDFHRQERQGTATASASQVRQPVYQSSVGKWKNYREQLQPLAEVLRAGGIEIE